MMLSSRGNFKMPSSLSHRGFAWWHLLPLSARFPLPSCLSLLSPTPTFGTLLFWEEYECSQFLMGAMALPWRRPSAMQGAAFPLPIPLPGSSPLHFFQFILFGTDGPPHRWTAPIHYIGYSLLSVALISPPSLP